jgi:alginate O-acetyltransferase complex protein AlgI
MIFLTYDFVGFAALFYLLYFLIPLQTLRLATIVVGSLAFQWHFGGWLSVIPVSILATMTFLAGRSGDQRAIGMAIAVCVLSLVFYKYTYFFTDRVVGVLAPAFGSSLHAMVQTAVPAVIPLGISFFTFEFVHYLVELRRGGRPITGFVDFLAFGLYWPTMVAGPIKRYQQFLPALHTGLAGPSAADAMIGLVRIAIGLVKKWGADNLMAWIEFNEGQFEHLDLETRWLFLAAIAFRILLDFSGYSDMAIGFARMMGIVVPENFNWPYVARTPIEFWQRWHMSLSSWIRDYIYIPLGGNRLGLPRRILNALIAMALCGLWHGPSWNFAVWGLYHGAGLAVASLLQQGMRRDREGSLVGASSADDNQIGRWEVFFRNSMLQNIADCLAWIATMLFVSIGWLLFFYPVETAWRMTRLLFGGFLP